MASTPPSSVLYSKVKDELTLPVPLAEATALCREAAKGTKWMHLLESEDSRLLVKYIPVSKNAKIEVLLSDAGGAATTVTLTGWFFGMGKSQLRKAVQKLHDAIEEQAKQGTLAPGASAPGP
jgi:hypothetical protein